MKEAIGFLNEAAGYVYLVDSECRIRWAGSAGAEAHERESLVRGVRKLIAEARGVREDKRAKLESAVGEIVGRDEEKAAASAV